MRDLAENGDVLKATARSSGFPIIMSLIAETVDQDTRHAFRESGIYISSDPSIAMRALSWLYRRRNAHDASSDTSRQPLAVRNAPNSWDEVTRYCIDSDIAPAPWVVLSPDDRAATACAHMSYPLVVKVLPSEADHKTELGLIKLHVRTPEEVDRHAADFRKRLGKPNAGVLVQEMVQGGVEVVLSCLRNSDFGPIISIGTGGIAVELYRDVTHLLLPTSPDQVIAALKKLKLWTLLQGFRGKPPADVDALVRATVQFGDMFLATPDVAEFEINPLIVKGRGEGLAAVDALVALKSS
jgi:acetate---CoA ligase (ADP-forming)